MSEEEKMKKIFQLHSQKPFTSCYTPQTKNPQQNKKYGSTKTSSPRYPQKKMG
jgi:hypothetical protein